MQLTLLVGLRLEWCKARARAARWVEEVELLQEEMCRVVFGNNESLIAYEGLVAYARRQAQLRHDLADCFDRIWAIHFLPTSMTTSSSACHVPDLHLPAAVIE